MNTLENKSFRVVDQFGTEKILHKRRGYGWCVQRGRTTITLHLNHVVGKLVGQRIHAERIKQNLTLEQLAFKAGLRDCNLKMRMWAIENSTRGEGIRFGTLYAIAIALNLEATALIPNISEIQEEFQVKVVRQEYLIPKKPKRNMAGGDTNTPQR